MKLKVFSGCPDGIHHILIAAPSRTKAHQIYVNTTGSCRCSLKSFSDYVSENFNDSKCKIALNHPNTLLQTKKKWGFVENESDWEIVPPKEQK